MFNSVIFVEILKILMSNNTTISSIDLNKEQFISQVLNDYRVICMSREASLLGRKEVLTGKAKFGIFGDGKELAQLVMSKFFNKGDFRSGYYRDQTFMMAIGELSVQEFFAGLYAHTDLEKEPNSAGRQMGGHFSTKSVDKDGNWLNLVDKKDTNWNVDISDSNHIKTVVKKGIKFQASAWAESGRMFAPLKRQAHIKSYHNLENGGKNALLKILVKLSLL